MNLSSSFSPHNDVLSASPDTKSEKLSLIEELKRRGRLSVSTKRYPDAKDLYTKAIDTFNTILKEDDNDDNSNNNTKKELAILFSNRSLCHLQMSQTQDAYNDALNATCHDQTYLKGFWRLGQSCMALENTEEALIAYEKAYALDGNNKALKKECEKVKKQLEVEKIQKQQEEDEKKKRMEQGKEEEKKVAKEVNGKSSSSKSVTRTTSTVSSSSSSSKKEEKTTISSSKEFTKSDHVRGYKIVNGKKTSFFHHEQTEEEKRLIGDITPKRIDVTAESQTSGPTKIDNNNNSNNKGGIKTSAWNTAGTWEEKDFTDWAIDSLKDQIMKCNYHLPDGSPDPKAHVQVTKLTKLLSSKVAGGTCHASVATVRGKKRYIFEFNVCVHWEMTLGDGRKCKGEMTFLDVDGTHEIGEGYDISDYNVDNDTPSDAKYLLERFVRDGGLRTTIEKAMDDWIGIFRDTH